MNYFEAPCLLLLVLLLLPQYACMLYFGAKVQIVIPSGSQSCGLGPHAIVVTIN